MTILSKINSRLWITYVLLVVFVLVVAFSGIVIAFRNSPLLYWKEFVQLNYVTNSLTNRLDFFLESNWEKIIHLFLVETDLQDVRVLIFDQDGWLKLDSMADVHSPVPMVADIPSVFNRTEGSIRLFQDNDRQFWFYQINMIDESLYLLAAIPRPKLEIRTIFQDELLKPLFRAGIIAMCVALVISWFVARWITNPLKNISASASKLATGDFSPIELKGPLEVQNLAQIINSMDRQVKDTMQSQKDFVANVSHEFKTPLTSIQGFTQAIQDGTIQSKEETRNAAAVILDETNRLNYLVNDLLTLAKLDAGTLKMDKRELNLNPIINKVVEKFSYQMSNKELEAEINFSADNVIMGDGERIIQVFNNLIDNAIKFSKPQGKIYISDQQDNRFVIIKVEDSGMGISKDETGKIFDRFYQADKSRGRKSSRSAGLGLSIANQIVKAHGGTISVDSELGKGSCFMVKLPIAHAISK